MLADRVESVEAYLGCFLGGFPAVHVNDRLVPVRSPRSSMTPMPGSSSTPIR